MKVGIIGGGNVGTCLAGYFKKQGVLEYITASTEEKTTALAAKFNLMKADNQMLVKHCDIIFLTVPDRKIAAVANKLASTVTDFHNKTFFHCSGSIGLDVLAALQQKGASVGSIHPLQSFAQNKTNLCGVYMAVDGDVTVKKTAEKLIQFLGGKPFYVPLEDRVLYHCAACICSNYMVALEYLAYELMQKWTGKTEAWQALKPLFQGTVHNLLTMDNPAAALTGPIARGDSITVEKHLHNLTPKYLKIYSSLGLLTAQIALTNGTIDKTKLQKLQNILQTPEV